MQIKSEFTAYIFIDSYGQEYLRLSKNNWMQRYGDSFESELYEDDRLEAEFEKQQQEDFASDKDAWCVLSSAVRAYDLILSY